MGNVGNLLGETMNDLTLLYYTSGLAEDYFLKKIRKHLVEVSGKNLPIVSVSQIPLDFGDSIYVGNLGKSIYNIYWQIYLGVQKIKTRYVACCEDDSLYTQEHFSFRPEKLFAFNTNRWTVNQFRYSYRTRTGMCMCIAPTDLLVNTLRLRFEKYPPLDDKSHLKEENLIGFGEPGKSEHKLGLPVIGLEIFRTKEPTLTFNHRPSLGGVRRMMQGDIFKDEIAIWGKASDLWKEYFSC
jgi:hypothetical protein